MGRRRLLRSHTVWPSRHSRAPLQAFSFGTVVADLATGGGGGTPSSANLRVSNVSKVACEVDLTVRSVDKTSALEPCAFAVQPAQLSIPALEHRYVRVSFHPKQINSFVAALEALVRNGQGCPSTHRFACELRVCLPTDSSLADTCAHCSFTITWSERGSHAAPQVGQQCTVRMTRGDRCRAEASFRL